MAQQLLLVGLAFLLYLCLHIASASAYSTIVWCPEGHDGRRKHDIFLRIYCSASMHETLLTVNTVHGGGGGGAGAGGGAGGDGDRDRDSDRDRDTSKDSTHTHDIEQLNANTFNTFNKTLSDVMNTHNVPVEYLTTGGHFYSTLEREDIPLSHHTHSLLEWTIVNVQVCTS
jgi:hypothetical protein